MNTKAKSFDATKLVITSPILARTNQVLQETQRFSNNNVVPSCSICASSQINLVRMPDDSLHYAAHRCAGCDTFRGWEPKPANQEKQRHQQKRVITLLQSPNLSQWEREFLLNVQYRRSLSPKQLQVLTRIEAKVGEQS
jgi:hypothetical protein